AAGEPLPLRQEDVELRGWAIECRIMAEDPWNRFYPSTGVIRGLRMPAGPGIRLDSGVEAGSEVSAYYDSLLAKLIATRRARGRWTCALGATACCTPCWTAKACAGWCSSGPSKVRWWYAASRSR